MARVRKTVSVHEKTVQKVAKNTIAAYPSKPRKPRRKTNVQIEIRIWSDGVNEMLVDYVERNNIHYSQIEIVSEDEIIIHNEETHDA